MPIFSGEQLQKKMTNIAKQVQIIYMQLKYKLYLGKQNVQCMDTIIKDVSKEDYSYEKGNVLFFQLQFGTYLPTFRLDALAILTVRMETSYETD